MILYQRALILSFKTKLLHFDFREQAKLFQDILVGPKAVDGQEEGDFGGLGSKFGFMRLVAMKGP